MEPVVSDLLDVDEGATFLRVKASTVRKWILEKQIPIVRLGRRVFLRRCDLQHLIEGGIVPAERPLRQR